MHICNTTLIDSASVRIYTAERLWKVPSGTKTSHVQSYSNAFCQGQIRLRCLHWNSVTALLKVTFWGQKYHTVTRDMHIMLLKFLLCYALIPQHKPIMLIVLHLAIMLSLQDCADQYPLQTCFQLFLAALATHYYA